MKNHAWMLFVALMMSSSLGLSCRESAIASDLPPARTDSESDQSSPELPRLSVELPAESSAAPSRLLRTGDDLQHALDSARPGDVIALEPGAVFNGQFRLPRKSGEQWITIRTAANGSFPKRGTRVNPSHAPMMPVLESGSGPAIAAAPGAHHYQFIGIEVRPRGGAFLHNLVTLGASEKSLEDSPHHIVFERSYLHGDPRVGARRGIALNSRHTAVIDSHLSDFKEQGADSQAIAGWNGQGPFAIVNNYLEGAGENVMFGGADPAIRNLVPSDIEFRRNHLAKPLTWRVGDPRYAGTPWAVKNLFELKNARRVLIEGNLFENNWQHAQNGFAILFTPRNQDGGAPWTVVEDVTFVNNIVRHSGSAVNLSGRDDRFPVQKTRRILIRNNLFQDIDGSRWGGGGRLFQLIGGAGNVLIDHNTAFHTGEAIMAEGDPHTGFVFTNNLTAHNEYGVTGTGSGAPLNTLATYFPGALFVKNVVMGAKAAHPYPPDNSVAATWAEVEFVDFTAGNYRLAQRSRYKTAGTDGRDVGADIDAIDAAMDGQAIPSPARRRPAVRAPSAPTSPKRR